MPKPTAKLSALMAKDCRMGLGMLRLEYSKAMANVWAARPPPYGQDQNLIYKCGARTG